MRTDDAILLIDGGTGTELQRRGFAMDDVAWSAFASVTAAPLLRQIHEDYIRAGARVITANTFASTRFVLEAAGAAGHFHQINTAALAAARHARESCDAGDVVIAASLSCLPPRFDPAAYPEEAAELAAYRECCELYASHGAELIILEMMEDTHHARLAAEAAFSISLPVWLGVSCRRDPGSGRPVSYDFPDRPLAATLNALADYPWQVISVMHTPMDAMLAGIDELLTHWSGPAGAWPELSDFRRDGVRVAPMAPADFAHEARAFVDAGARVLGGCCGTTPAHIEALRDELIRPPHSGIKPG